MNEVLKAIAGRYSCRDFADTPLTQAQVKALVDAALAAPSAMNRQPWHVIMVTDKALIDDMDAAGMEVIAENKEWHDRIMERGGKIFYNAPCMMMIARDGSDWGTLDAGILCQNVALAAHSMGLGNVICGMANIPLTGPRGDEFKQRMKFPEGYSFAIAVLVGTANSGKEPHELDAEKVTYIG
jgi:nitroreductase